MLLPIEPSWVMLLGNQLAIFQRMRFAASASPTPDAISVTLNAQIINPIVVSFLIAICSSLPSS